MIITVKQVLSFDPCIEYNTVEKILPITGGRDRFSTTEVINFKLSANDKMWLLSRCFGLTIDCFRNCYLAMCDVIARIDSFPTKEEEVTEEQLDLIRCYANCEISRKDLLDELKCDKISNKNLIKLMLYRGRQDERTLYDIAYRSAKYKTFGGGNTLYFYNDVVSPVSKNLDEELNWQSRNFLKYLVA